MEYKGIREKGITISELWCKVQHAFEDMGYEEGIEQVNDIGWNNRLRSTSARVVLNNGYDDVDIEFNPNTYLDLLEDLVKHEVLHVIVRAGDSDKEFKEECRKRGIPLYFNTIKSQEDYKYIEWCDNCNEWYRRYRRKSHKLKRTIENPGSFYCKSCGEYGEIKVKDLRSGKIL